MQFSQLKEKAKSAKRGNLYVNLHPAYMAADGCILKLTHKYIRVPSHHHIMTGRQSGVPKCIFVKSAININFPYISFCTRLLPLFPASTFCFCFLPLCIFWHLFKLWSKVEQTSQPRAEFGEERRPEQKGKIATILLLPQAEIYHGIIQLKFTLT